MLFSSMTFLYYFLPVTILIYYVMPEKWKNGILFLASFFFYFWGEPKYSVLLLISVGIGYVGGRCIAWAGECSKPTVISDKLFLILFLIAQLSLLAIFKYTDFFIKSWNSVTNSEVPLLQVALPIGISFYSFQIISYLVDVYRKEVPPEKNVIDFAAYVTMFPQLVAGPIVRYESIRIQMKKRENTLSNLSRGAGRFVCGLAKKVLVADTLGQLVSTLSLENEIGIAGYWMLAVAYMLQIYYDFSGYSDMAIGMGKMFGFTFPENFTYPYIAKSITEFWRRWHRTLSGWFRDYLYIPLGGNRVSFLRWCFHMLLVWFLSGLWHGASWNFALWGVYFGIFLIFEKTIAKSGKVRVPVVLKHSYTLLVVMFSFVIFRADSLSEMGTQFAGLFGGNGYKSSAGAIYQMKSYSLIMIAAAVGATPFLHMAYEKCKETGFYEKVGHFAEVCLIFLGLILSTAFLMGSSVHPFLYFRF